MALRITGAATSPAAECGSSRSAPAGRRASARRARSRPWTQLTATLVGEAATLARTHGETLARLPATVHAFILVELQKWPTLFHPEQRYQRALLEHLAHLQRSELDRATAGIARIEVQAGINKVT